MVDCAHQSVYLALLRADIVIARSRFLFRADIFMYAIVKITGKACASGQLSVGIMRVFDMIFAVSVFGIKREIACVPAGGIFQNRRVCQLVQTDLCANEVEVVQRIALPPDLRCRRIDKFSHRQGLVLGMVENACCRAQQEQSDNKGFHDVALSPRQRDIS